MRRLACLALLALSLPACEFQRSASARRSDGVLLEGPPARNLATAVRNSLEMLDVDLPHAARMASLYPATFLGLDRELGRIEPGYRADLVLVDADLNVTETWIDGHSTP